jgi:hypothetical protein
VGAGPPYEQRHRGDHWGGGDRRPERGSRCQHHYLAQRFKELIGVTPKRLARTYRFTATVFAITPAGPVDWADLAGGAGYFDQAHFGHESGRSPGSRRPGTSKSGGGSCANIPATRWTAGRCRPIDFLQERQLTTR